MHRFRKEKKSGENFPAPENECINLFSVGVNDNCAFEGGENRGVYVIELFDGVFGMVCSFFY